VEIGGESLFMLVNDNGDSCLHVAAEEGHADVAKVRQGMCRQIDRKEALRRQIRHKRQDSTMVTHLFRIIRTQHVSMTHAQALCLPKPTACYW